MQYDRQCVPIKCRRLSRRHPFFRRLSSDAGLWCRSLQPDRVLRYRALMVVDQTLPPVIWFALINGEQASDAVGAGWRAICGHDDGLPDLEAMFRHFLAPNYFEPFWDRPDLFAKRQSFKNARLPFAIP